MTRITDEEIQARKTNHGGLMAREEIHSASIGAVQSAIRNAAEKLTKNAERFEISECYAVASDVAFALEQIADAIEAGEHLT
jgi:hypothetical protein